MSTLSVVINTLNAAETLEQCLDTVSFADEIIVVDMKSVDDTVKIAKKHKAKTFFHQPTEYVEPARNFALEKATKDWVLVIDADEEVPEELAELITKIVSGEIDEELSADCYYVPRKNELFGKYLHHTGWWPDYVLRLFKKGYVQWPETIHSVPVTKGVVRELPAKSEFAIHHHNYQTIEQFINRLNRYTSIQAQSADEEPALTAFANEWFKRYFFEAGTKDGNHGYYASLLQSMSELVVQAKKWQAAGFPDSKLTPSERMKEVTTFKSELSYWIANWQVENTQGITKIWWQIRRKLRF